VSIDDNTPSWPLRQHRGIAKEQLVFLIVRGQDARDSPKNLIRFEGSEGGALQTTEGAAVLTPNPAEVADVSEPERLGFGKASSATQWLPKSRPAGPIQAGLRRQLRVERYLELTRIRAPDHFSRPRLDHHLPSEFPVGRKEGQLKPYRKVDLVPLERHLERNL